MAIICDSVKRAACLAAHGLDFHDAEEIFAGRVFTQVDNRQDHGELRLISAGHLRGRFVIVVWSPRGKDRRVFSMRYGHAKEEKRTDSFG